MQPPTEQLTSAPDVTDSRAASPVVCISALLEHPVCDKETRLEELTAKINRGEHLTMAERVERQGIIFNHHGNIAKIKIKLV